MDQVSFFDLGFDHGPCLLLVGHNTRQTNLLAYSARSLSFPPIACQALLPLRQLSQAGWSLFGRLPKTTRSPADTTMPYDKMVPTVKNKVVSGVGRLASETSRPANFRAFTRRKKKARLQDAS